MATKQRTIDYLLEQLAGAGDISTRKMFGEYALYHESKVVAFICDDRLFIKPTEPGRDLEIVLRRRIRFAQGHLAEEIGVGNAEIRA